MQIEGKIWKLKLELGSEMEQQKMRTVDYTLTAKFKFFGGNDRVCLKNVNTFSLSVMFAEREKKRHVNGRKLSEL